MKSARRGGEFASRAGKKRRKRAVISQRGMEGGESRLFIGETKERRRPLYFPGRTPKGEPR